MQSGPISNPGRTCDALVVGGGPAGLASAIALRQRGLDVVLAEALRPPIDKACGEGLTPDCCRELMRLGVQLDNEAGLPFSGIHFAYRGGNKQLLAWAAFFKERGFGMRRVDLHDLLCRRAQALGVRLLWGRRVELPSASNAHGRATVGGEAYLYKYLVGADGQASRVRRWANLEAGSLWSRRLGFRRHYQIEPWSDHVEVHWGGCGQAYVTPVSRDEICVAAITRHPQVGFEQTLAGLPFLQEKLRARKVYGKDRGALTTTRQLRRVTRGNIALVGDASGSVDAVTGEGLASAFREALLLGAALSREGLPEYEVGHANILRLPQTMAMAMLAMDRWPTVRSRVMRMLAGHPKLFAGLLGVHTGEQRISDFLLAHGSEAAFRLVWPGEGCPGFCERAAGTGAESLIEGAAL